jgi:hypothetical protein
MSKLRSLPTKLLASISSFCSRPRPAADIDQQRPDQRADEECPDAPRQDRPRRCRQRCRQDRQYPAAAPTYDIDSIARESANELTPLNAHGATLVTGARRGIGWRLVATLQLHRRHRHGERIS